MGDISRRAFLKTSSAVMAAGAAVAALPATPAVLGALEAQGPADADAADAAAADAEVAGSASEPVVAHFDPVTGETAVYRGTSEVVVKDPALAARLMRALR